MFPRTRHVFLDDTGATTEYALVLIIGATLAAALFVIVRSDPIQQALADLVHRALRLEG